MTVTFGEYDGGRPPRVECMARTDTESGAINRPTLEG